MKKIAILITVLVTIYSCSSNKVDQATALKYYETIQTVTTTQVSDFKNFMSVFKQSFETAQLKNPQKLDSVELDKFKLAYQTFMTKLDSGKTAIKNLNEIDSEINLKIHLENQMAYVDSSLKTIMPEIIMILETGLESGTEETQTKIESFKKAVAVNKDKGTKIESLSVQFQEKYGL